MLFSGGFIGWKIIIRNILGGKGSKLGVDF